MIEVEVAGQDVDVAKAVSEAAAVAGE